MSSFTRLEQLKIDIIKIDGSFIQNIDNSLFDMTIVESIVNIARSLGMKTVAEYVHSKEVFDIAKKLGVDYFQGYYIAKPTPLSSIPCGISCDSQPQVVLEEPLDKPQQI